MKRREFMTLIGGAAASLPIAARAQQKPMPVIGLLSPGPPGAGGPLMDGFRLGLSEAGYTEGQNVTIEYRWVEANDRLPAMAADLVGSKVDLILAITDPVALTAKGASSTIPMVFFIGGDPVANGLVASLARPGGNLTGVTLFGDEFNPKRLELLSELVTEARVIALLVNPNNPLGGAAPVISSKMQEAARAKGVQLRIVNAASESEIDAAFAALPGQQARALVIDTDLFFFGQRQQIVALAARHSIPAIYYRREFVDGRRPDQLWTELCNGLPASRHVCRKVLGGVKPSDLPVHAADQVRTGHQSQDRQGARPHGAADAAGARRRGDRMKRREFIRSRRRGGAWPLARARAAAAMPVIGFLQQRFAEPM